MDARDNASVNTPSVRSRKQKLVPIRVLTDSRRASIDFTSSATSMKRDIMNLMQKVAVHSRNLCPSSTERRAQSLSKNIANEQTDPSQCKKAEFGDSRPLVRDVWTHYPFQEAPPLPKDTREPLNKVLNRKSVFAPKMHDELESESSASSHHEIELEQGDNCHFETFPALPHNNRPSSANAKIDSHTKIKAIEDLDNQECESSKKTQELILNSEPCSNEIVLGPRIDSPSKNIFKIKNSYGPKGVVDANIWKKVPASPHIENHLVESYYNHPKRRSVMNPLSGDDSPFGRSSLHYGLDSRNVSRDKGFDIKLSDASKPACDLKLKQEASGLAKSSSLKVFQRSKVTFSPQVSSQQMHDLHGFTNWASNAASRRNSIRAGTESSGVAPFGRGSQEAALSQTEAAPELDQTKPKRKASVKLLPHFELNSFTKEEKFGLKRRVSIITKKAAKADGTASISKCQTKGTITDSSPIAKVKV